MTGDLVTGARPYFLYLPACVLSEQEMRLTKEQDNYHELLRRWENLDVALVKIGNFPSVPDFASEARCFIISLMKRGGGNGRRCAESHGYVCVRMKFPKSL